MSSVFYRSNHAVSRNHKHKKYKSPRAKKTTAVKYLELSVAIAATSLVVVATSFFHRRPKRHRDFVGEYVAQPIPTSVSVPAPSTITEEMFVKHCTCGETITANSEDFLKEKFSRHRLCSTSPGTHDEVSSYSNRFSNQTAKQFAGV